MSYTLKYFMWSYQLNFQISAEVEARSLIRKLDPESEIRLFMVGFLEEESANRHSVCVVPDDCVLQPEVFAKTLKAAKELGAYDLMADGIQTLPIAQERMIARKESMGYYEAVKNTVQEHSDTAKWITYVSWPVQIEGYRVLVVLQLPRTTHEKYYHLTNSSAQGNYTTPFAVQRSLVEPTVDEFLSVCVEELKKPEPGSSWGIVKDYDNIIRSAGKRMMDAPAIAGGNEHGLHGQFKACEAISALLYEGSEGKGHLVYVNRDHPSIHATFSLKDEIPVTDYGAIRKALQLASGGLALLCDSAKVYAIGSVENYDARREDIFEVWFDRRFSWRLTHDGNPLMYVEHGRPALFLPGFPEEKFKRDLPRVIKGLSQKSIEALTELGRCLATQKHGAMLVVSANAADESRRLANQCTRVGPFLLSDELIPHVTSIDGAVLVDPMATCHAIGVILDGLSHAKCTPARGARYNSAVRYVYGRKDAIAIVKSEDGIVNILPDLMPLIRKSDIEIHLAQLRELAGAEVIERKPYRKLMDWFDKRRFYLLADVCDEINHLWPVAENKLDDKSWLIKLPQFTPNEEMDQSFFVESNDTEKEC